MSNNNWKFDPSDFDNDSVESNESSDTGSPIDGNNLGMGAILLPLTIIGVYALVAKGVVLTAIEGIVGAGGLALAITNAFWVIGLITGGIIAVFAILTVLNLLGAAVKRSAVNGILGAVGLLYFGVGWAGATFLFDSVPFLVGFVLLSNLVLYGGIVALVFVIGAGATILAP